MKIPCIPADLATLAWAEPGQEVEVRCTLPGAGSLAELLTPGSRVRCSEVDDEYVVVEAPGDLKLRIPVQRARLIQVERTNVGAPAD